MNLQDELQRLFKHDHWVEWRGRPVLCRIVALGWSGEYVMARVKTETGADIVACLDELTTSRKHIVTKIQEELNA